MHQTAEHTPSLHILHNPDASPVDSGVASRPHPRFLVYQDFFNCANSLYQLWAAETAQDDGRPIISYHFLQAQDTCAESEAARPKLGAFWSFFVKITTYLQPVLVLAAILH